MIRELKETVNRLTGTSTTEKVMEGSDEINEKTSKKRIAEWVKGAMERLDTFVDEKSRIKIMENCGYNCATVNKKVIDRAKARRMKYQTIDEFLDAEERKPSSGTRIFREERLLHYFYTPKTFFRPMRCYCSLLRGLPEDETVSSTYCNCAKGFVKKYWESVLGKPVQVQLKQSAVAGAEECEFIIQY